MEELKPCPFCGCDDPYYDEIDIFGDGKHLYLSCPECSAEGPIGKTHEEAAAKWNARKESA